MTGGPLSFPSRAVAALIGVLVIGIITPRAVQFVTWISTRISLEVSASTQLESAGYTGMASSVLNNVVRNFGLELVYRGLVPIVALAVGLRLLVGRTPAWFLRLWRACHA